MIFCYSLFYENFRVCSREGIELVQIPCPLGRLREHAFLDGVGSISIANAKDISFASSTERKTLERVFAEEPGHWIGRSRTGTLTLFAANANEQQFRACGNGTALVFVEAPFGGYFDIYTLEGTPAHMIAHWVDPASAKQYALVAMVPNSGALSFGDTLVKFQDGQFIAV